MSAMPRPAMRTFLFSDLRDYTVFIETRGDEAATKMLRASRRIVREAVAKHRGAEVKTEGDSFYVVFRSPSAAVRCAIEIQRGSARHTERHTDLPVRMGVGINTGEAIPHDNGYVGAAVIVATRLSTGAKAGQILVTDTVRSLMRTGGHAPMHELGLWSLKGIAEPIRVFEVDPYPSSAIRSLGPTLPLPPLLQARAVVETSAASPELVGRDREVKQVREEVAAAARGEFRIVAISGEAGIGKTRFCREIAALAHRDGHYVLGGRSHAGRLLPYEPFVAALRPYARARGADVLRRILGPLMDEVRLVLPEIEVPSTRTEGSPDAERRDRSLRTVQLLLEDAASQRPVLLVIEDVQEADGSTLDLLRYVATSLRSGVCILLTYREEEVSVGHPARTLLAELERDGRLARARLGPLDLEGVRRITELALPGRASAELARIVYERTDGVPFYVEELLKTAADDVSGALELAVPLSVRDSVHVRVGRLVAERGPGSGDLLELLSIAEVPLGPDVLAAAADRSMSEVVEDLTAAIQAQLLERPPTTRDLFQFRHALTRDTVRAGIDDARRRRLHADLARALESTVTPFTAPMLARHFAEAGDRDRALRYARQGAASAREVGAFETSIQLLTRSALLARGTADEREVLEELAVSLQAAGHVVEAEDALRRVRTLCPADAVESLARVDIQLASVLRAEGRRVESLEVAERAVALLQPGGDGLLGDALVALADLSLADGDTERASDLSERALRIGREHGHPALEVSALTVLGLAKARGSDPDALATLREAIRVGSDAGLRAETVTAWLDLSRAQLARSEFLEAGASSEAALRLAREYGLELLQSRALRQLTTIFVNHGRYAEARAVAEQAVALARPDTVAGDNAKISLAHILTNEGEHDPALVLLDHVAPHVHRLDPDQRVLYFAYRAQALVSADRLDEAASAADAAVSETTKNRGLGMTGFLAAAAVAEARRDTSRLRALGTAADSYFADRQTPAVRAMRREIEAIVAALEGRDVGHAFSELAAIYDSIGAQVHATYRRASGAIARMSYEDERREAQRELETMRGILVARGAGRYVGLIDKAVRRPGGRSAAHRTLLQGRQLRVAVMLSRGYTDRRIAAELNASQKDAARLVAEVLDRLGVRSRAQVASWVIARSPGERETALRR